MIPLSNGGNRPNVRPGMTPAPLRPLPPPRPAAPKKPAEKTATPLVQFTKAQLDEIGKRPLRPEDVLRSRWSRRSADGVSGTASA